MRTVAALIAGFALGLGATAVAATTANYPYQTWLGVKDIQAKVGNPYTYQSSDGTLAGEIGRVDHEIGDLQLKISKLCQLQHTIC
jgi:hypothetical protein